MRKAFYIISFILVSFAVFGQDYKPFRVILGGGYAIGSNSIGGIFGTLEPGYRLSNEIAVGLRGEIAGIAKGSRDGLAIDVDVSAISSTTLNGVYYFKGEVRPFIGAGLGRYSISGFGYRVGVSGPEEKKGREAKLGFYPRAGVEFGHLGFTIDYNIIPPTKLPNGTEFKNNYIDFRFSVFFGGGKMREDR
jgi:hypothetical protein